MNNEAAIKREKRKAYDKHWTTLRSAVAHHEAFSRPNGAKGNRRHLKALKLAHRYREFFANSDYYLPIIDLGLEWAVDMNPRMVRDTVLGSARDRAVKHGA